MSVNLKNLSVCENLIVSLDGKISLINIFSELTAPNFPALHPKLVILISIEGDIGTHSESVEIIDPNGRVVSSTTGNAEIKGAGGNNFVATFINIALPVDGQYWIRVTVDGNILTNKINHFIAVKKV